MSAIFISHSTKDHADTEAMATWLKQQGHTSYFIDYDEQSGIRAGADWAQSSISGSDNAKLWLH
jgi:hypothetical protein